ncbi:MAG: ROK family protein [Limisphaerales bacterium]
MRRINQLTLVGRLQAMRLASRADLAKALGLSQPTAGKIVDGLLRHGIVEEVSASDEATPGAPPIPGGSLSRLGRPGRLLRLDRNHSRFLAIQLDVCDTWLTELPVGGDGEDRWTIRVATGSSAADWVKELRSAAARCSRRDFWGVLVSVPGIVDEPAGRVVFSPNLHWTERIELPELIRRVWDAPVLVMQEERALALGHQAVASPEDGFLLVDFGEGVGGAVILEGKLYANPLPISGELGHTPVLGNRRRCGCGAVGCVETLVSRRGLLASFAASHRQEPHTWPALVEHLSLRGVVPWLAEALDASGAIIAGAVNVLGLRRVIITGSLTELPAAVLDHLSAAIRGGAMWARFGDMIVQSAPRRRGAGLVAAAIDRLLMPVGGSGQLDKIPPAHKTGSRPAKIVAQAA